MNLSIGAISFVALALIVMRILFLFFFMVSPRLLSRLVFAHVVSGCWSLLHYWFHVVVARYLSPTGWGPDSKWIGARSLRWDTVRTSTRRLSYIYVGETNSQASCRRGQQATTGCVCPQRPRKSSLVQVSCFLDECVNFRTGAREWQSSLIGVCHWNTVTSTSYKKSVKRAAQRTTGRKTISSKNSLPLDTQTGNPVESDGPAQGRNGSFDARNAHAHAPCSRHVHAWLQPTSRWQKETQL